MIDLIIADDHKVFREGIVALLQQVPGMRVIGEASSGEEVLRLLESRQPQVILMDISMGNTSGIETTHQLKERYPDIQVLVLSMHQEGGYIVKMIEAGANGYLLKDVGKEEMVNAIRQVAAGETYFSGKVSAAMIEQLNLVSKSPGQARKKTPLTPRETEILKLIAEEHTNAEIAAALHISLRTVDTHKRNLLQKLDVKNTAGLVRFAIREGIVSNE